MPFVLPLERFTTGQPTREENGDWLPARGPTIEAGEDEAGRVPCMFAEHKPTVFRIGVFRYPTRVKDPDPEHSRCPECREVKAQTSVVLALHRTFIRSFWFVPDRMIAESSCSARGGLRRRIGRTSDISNANQADLSIYALTSRHSSLSPFSGRTGSMTRCQDAVPTRDAAGKRGQAPGPRGHRAESAVQPGPGASPRFPPSWAIRV